MTFPFPMYSPANQIVFGNLVCHLDAGDADSYSGSGQIWSDLSVEGNDFYLGATSSSQASDPTFNGAAGGESSGEYFSLDGGDWFTVVSDPSGNIFRKLGRSDIPLTIEMWCYALSWGFKFGGGNISLGTDRGLQLFMNNNASKAALLAEPTGTPFEQQTDMPTGTWFQNVVAAKPDGNTTCTWYRNGTPDGTGTLNNTWSSGASTHTGFTFGAMLGMAPLLNGSRIAIIRVYDAILSDAQVLQNFNANKNRFGL